MPISLIIGPPNSGRARVVRDRLEGRLERDPVLVVPTGDDAARFERDLCEPGHAVLGVSIRTFASLVEDVIRAAGLHLAPPLAAPERLALIRAAISRTPLRLLGRSAAHSGFAPALDALIAELQAAMVAPPELEAAAAELEAGEYELELAALYRAYLELRELAQRSDAGARAEAAVRALAAPNVWADRPILVYGFDDLSRVQFELLGGLGGTAEVIVAVDYSDREALKARASLVGRLRDELAAEVELELEHDPNYTERADLRHLDRFLFEAPAPTVDPGTGLALLDCAGELGEAEAIGGEIAGLLSGGVAPDGIAVVVRDAPRRGPVIGRVLSRLGIPTAVESSVGLDHTAVGRSLVALCRAASPDGGPDDLLAHLRANAGMAAGVVDRLERRVRRDRPASIEDAIAGWKSPPRHLAQLRSAPTPGARMRALAAIGRELAEDPHRAVAPVTASDGGSAPFEPLELRAAAVAGELLEQLAEIGALPGCDPPDLAEAAEAIEGARVPLWRGPTDGRVRVLDPYRMRAGRARHLFCAGLQEGEFPRRSVQDPLLSDERRARLGIAELVRQDPQDEERYLFHSCVSRPTERLYLSWQSCDDDGAPLARSPFVDEVLDLFEPDPKTVADALTQRRGLERVTFDPPDAPTERELARSLALAGPRIEPELPGPLTVAAVLDDLSSRELLSASSLEGWLECSYRWFVNHELAPQRLDPQPDPLRLGTVAHESLQRLYAEPPGAEAIPRRDDVERWKRRLGELIGEVACDKGMRPDEPPDSVALARLRAQIDRFLEEEADSETAFRPRPDLLEAGFGFEDDDRAPLELGKVGLRGRIDRVDVAPDGRTALVRDYKTSSKIAGLSGWEAGGKLQLQLYILAARERLGLDPVGGLYHLLGARDDRRPRGMVVKDEPRLGDLPEGMVRGDPCDPDAFESELDRARVAAIEKAEEMRAGEIDRDPIGGRCPRYCTFQTICRLERAVGLEDEPQNGEGE